MSWLQYIENLFGPQLETSQQCKNAEIVFCHVLVRQTSVDKNTPICQELLTQFLKNMSAAWSGKIANIGRPLQSATYTRVRYPWQVQQQFISWDLAGNAGCQTHSTGNYNSTIYLWAHLKEICLCGTGVKLAKVGKLTHKKGAEYNWKLLLDGNQTSFPCIFQISWTLLLKSTWSDVTW